MDFKQTSIKQSALGWVKKSIDETLESIRRDLNGYIEDNDDAALQRVQEQLASLRGVLTMIEQYGAAMLTEEMEALAAHVANREQRDEAALEVLLRAVLQLPDYLEHIQAGQQDIPIAILPLLNDIRAARNQDLFSEKLLFLPDLSMHHEDGDAEQIEEPQNLASRALAKKLRPTYQFSLLGVIRENEVVGNLARLARISEVLEERAHSEQVARLWWIVGALIESIARDDLPLGVSVKMLLGKVDQLLRQVILHGERELLTHQPIDLIKNLLYYIAQPECNGPKSQAIKTAYRLEQFLPSDSAEGAIAGPNQELMKTVAEAVCSDLEQVKSRLEVYVNGDMGDTAQLAELPRELHVISDTLAMIGLGSQREMIEAQIDSIEAIIEGREQPQQERLLNMASELLQVEQALEMLEKRPYAMEEEESADRSLDFEMDNMLSGVVTASLDNIQKIKDAILDFIKDSTKEENLGFCRALLTETGGALTLLNENRAVTSIQGLIDYLDSHDVVDFMDADRLDQLSQVVVSLEYYLEALGEKRSDADSVLEFAETQLELLLKDGYQRGLQPETPEDLMIDDADDHEVHAIDEAELEPVDLANMEAELSEPAPAEPQDSGQEPLPEVSDLEDLTEIEMQAMDAPAPPAEAVSLEEIGNELEQLRESLQTPGSEVPGGLDIDLTGEVPVVPAEEEATAAAPAPTAAAPEPETPAATEEEPVLKPGSDPEILEIYLEEAEEESESIRQQQQDWLRHPADENALKNIRRSFHTIKGSGRLVGALKIGEFAWDFESLLNRVIDKTVPVSTPIIEAVGEAAKALPELIEEIKSGKPPQADITRLRGLARSLAVFDSDQAMELHRTGVIPAVSAAQHAPESKAEAEPGEAPAEEDDGAALEIEPMTEVLPRIDDEAPLPGVDFDLHGSETASEPDAEPEFPAIDEAEAGAPEPEAAAEEEPSPGDLPEAPEEPVQATADDREENSPDPFSATAGEALPGEEAEPAPSESPEPSEETGLQLDPELLIIYQQEVESHLGTVNSVLEEALAQGELPPREDLYRALHTIHGASRTADIETIGLLARLMEAPLKTLLEQGKGLDSASVDLYRRGSDAIESMTRELVVTRSMPELDEGLREDFEQLMDSLVDHTVVLSRPLEQPGQTTQSFLDTMSMMNEGGDEDYDDELVGIFIEEAVDLLEMSDRALQAWSEEDAASDEAPNFNQVMELQRYLHTLKGGAKMADFSAISDLSHELESLFIAVIDGRVEKTEELIEVLRDSFDLLHRQVEQAQARQPMDSPQTQIDLLQRLRRGEDLEAEAPAAGPEEAPAVEEPQPDTGEAVSAKRSEPAPAETRSGEQDIVKVRSDLLDNLVNSAGEVSIYRARMEQQVASFGSHLGELAQTILRLKNQLRQLEAETDAQIHFSHRRDAELTQSFDPLEMDRYTQIQELSRALSESVDDLSSLQGLLGEQVKDSETLLLQQSRINTDLQDGLIRSRMVRFSGLTSRLRRLVRKTAAELAKKAKLEVHGEDNEVDVKVLDRMVAPLEHILRNAISHGIEKPIERLNKGKPETGTIRIDISRDGSDVVLRISDDGSGINIDKVRARALELGLMQPEDKLPDEEIVQFILEPGFSTAEQVTQVAGRGVGMDVVDSHIKQLGGTLQISSGPEGTVFTARLPFTLSINQAILLRAGDEAYALPLINIEGITRIEAEQVEQFYRQEKPQLHYAGQVYQLYYLSSLVGVSQGFKAQDPQAKEPVILVRSGDQRVALHIDEIIGNREIVVKPLGKLLNPVKGLSGATILADGRVVLILEINGLVRHGLTSSISLQPGLGEAVEQVERVLPDSEGGRRKVMVVDDSITMRRVATRLLSKNDYDVVTAKDGVDALAQLEEAQPDVMLLDIEMPRMDGFELATHMKNEPRFRDIPIIMITSRTGAKHRDHAMQIGVDRYMGKPYQEDELLENIAALVRRA